MSVKTTWLAGVIVMFALGVTFAVTPMAQTTVAVDERNFEVLSVDGNKLVVRDQKGTHEYTVPSDFRFNVDGKQVAVSELKAGMKGKATITTTTTVKPVVITEVREGDVLRASDQSMTVRVPDGSTRKFLQGELDNRGIQIIKDGKPVRMADLRKGDKLSATIVTAGPPVVLTEQEVQATLADTKADAPPTKVAAATTTGSQAGAAPQSGAAKTASPSADASGLGMTWYVVIAALVAAALFFFMRRRK